MTVAPDETAGPAVSVLMPTYRQAHFLPRAVRSLQAQRLEDWELIVVDDGSPDETAATVKGFAADPRIRYERLEHNTGLGAACNRGLGLAQAPLIAYLPSDDIYDPDHLASLVGCLEDAPGAVLAYSGVRHEHRVPGRGVLHVGTSTGVMEGWWLQLAQVVHRRGEDRWTERDELVTDDLERMCWSKLRAHGPFVGSGVVTCEWVDHPAQRHKVLREPYGGVNPYRSYYRVATPLRFHSTQGNMTDEVELYRRFRERPDTPRAAEGLRILIVGELAFNPERVLALEERGHELHGLWIDDGHWFNAIGPVPFGHVADVPLGDWRAAVRRLRPDVVYGLLNWVAIPLAHAVLEELRREAAGAPFVWHLKEGPFDCIANGYWPKLVELCTLSDAQVYSSPEMRDWMEAVLPGEPTARRSMVLDGDLPKQEWFTDDRVPLASATDWDLHTVVPGGPIGMTPELMEGLAARGVHLHFYGDFHQGQWKEWTARMAAAGGQRFHLHHQVTPLDWVKELSRYDAGWLHQFRSRNGGALARADWGDLNYPARIPTLMSAGVPLIQVDNGDSMVAQQALADRLGVGVSYDPDDISGLCDQLYDLPEMADRRSNAWAHRSEFTFDHHVERLVDLFRDAIADRRGTGAGT